MEIRLIGGVVEFIFGPSQRIVFNDEGQPGLKVGRDKKSRKVVAFMCLHMPNLYNRVLAGLREKPTLKKFSVTSVDEGDKTIAVCDPRVKNTTMADIVQWVWESYYSPHLQRAVA